VVVDLLSLKAFFSLFINMVCYAVILCFAKKMKKPLEYAINFKYKKLN